MTDIISLEAIKPEPLGQTSCGAGLETTPPVCADDGPC